MCSANAIAVLCLSLSARCYQTAKRARVWRGTTRRRSSSGESTHFVFIFVAKIAIVFSTESTRTSAGNYKQAYSYAPSHESLSVYRYHCALRIAREDAEIYRSEERVQGEYGRRSTLPLGVSTTVADEGSRPVHCRGLPIARHF